MIDKEVAYDCCRESLTKLYIARNVLHEGRCQIRPMIKTCDDRLRKIELEIDEIIDDLENEIKKCC